MDSAVNAHINSPFRAQAQAMFVANESLGNSHLPNNNSPSPNSPPDNPLENEMFQTTGGDNAVHNNTQPTMPQFDRLAYTTLDQIYNDWFGESDSIFSTWGGVKALYNNKDFRKALGTEKTKCDADKKMLQKMRRIGEYIEASITPQNDKQCVFMHIRQLIAASPKNAESLTGIDKLLQREKQSQSGGSSPANLED